MNESARQKESRLKNLSLHPLKFDEAITALLKIKPMPKPPKKPKSTPEASESKLGTRGSYAKKGKPKGSGFNARAPKPKR